MKNIKSCIALNNGVKMPYLGFGTYNANNANQLKDSIIKALQIGYRHIDTASEV